MVTGTKGTAESDNRWAVINFSVFVLLTPAEDGYENELKFCDLFEYNDQFLEEQDSFSTHPHPGDQDEIVEEHTHSDTTSSVLSTTNTSHKHYQHEQH